VGEGQAFEVDEFDEIAFALLFDVGVADVVVLVSFGPVRANERVFKLLRAIVNPPQQIERCCAV
jgi:hypothetical protein